MGRIPSPIYPKQLGAIFIAQFLAKKNDYGDTNIYCDYPFLANNTSETGIYTEVVVSFHSFYSLARLATKNTALKVLSSGC